MGSDSQASEVISNTRFAIEKIFPLTSRAVWGATGWVGIMDDIRSKVERHGCRGELEKTENVGTVLQRYIQPILTDHYKHFIPQVPNAVAASPATTTVACGYTPKNSPFIVEVDHQCGITYHHERGVFAAGSGGGFATVAAALLSHFDLVNKPVSHGLLAAWRVLNIVIETSSFGVGHPIVLWLMSPDQEPRQLDSVAMTEIQNQVGGWQALEHEALEQVLGGGVVSPEPMPQDAAPNE